MPDRFGNQMCTVGIPSAQFNFSYASQRGQNWCWAACIEMILRHYGCGVPQERVVMETFGTLVDSRADHNIILRNLNRVWQTPSGSFRVGSDFLTVPPHVAAHALKDESPIIVGTMGHAMVLTAMTYIRAANGAGQPTEMIVRDPWPYNLAPSPLFGPNGPGAQGRRSLNQQQQFGLNPQNGGFVFRVSAQRIA
ncbi:MAG: papain-like cysteine protease family protein [Bryobacteraceae bacterium]|nr:papain-like cysteine protease family protein [Bryobacteraceae bacterium]